MFGERVAEARKAKGLSLRKLGEMAGCTGQYIHLIETGAHTPAAGAAKRIIEALGLTCNPWVEKLLEGKVPRRLTNGEAAAIAWLLTKKGSPYLSDIAKAAEEGMKNAGY